MPKPQNATTELFLDPYIDSGYTTSSAAGNKLPGLWKTSGSTGQQYTLFRRIS